MSNRREHERHAVWFPVEISADAGEGIAISYDLSSGGLLMACPGRLEPGAMVSVKFRVTAEAPEREVRGSVVRVEPNEADRDGPWHWRIAVSFDEPVPDVERLLASRKA